MVCVEPSLISFSELRTDQKEPGSEVCEVLYLSSSVLTLPLCLNRIAAAVGLAWLGLVF